jgi:hypothetical protein
VEVKVTGSENSVNGMFDELQTRRDTRLSEELSALLALHHASPGLCHFADSDTLTLVCASESPASDGRRPVKNGVQTKQLFRRTSHPITGTIASPHGHYSLRNVPE